MSMADLERALALIKEHKDQASFVGRRPKLLIRAAEKALGLKMPPSYRRFLNELGAGNFGAAEIYGIVNADFERSSVPDGVWFTIRARDEDKLPKELVVIGAEDDEITCLAVPAGAAATDEAEVVVINAGEDKERAGTRTIAPDFGSYLLTRVEEELEAVQ
jgi:antitoxin YobK